MDESTAQAFLKDLEAQATEAGRQRTIPDDNFIGVRMGTVFALAKTYIDMSLEEIEKLLESPIHEARVGAVSIMDYQARAKKTSAKQKKALFDLYLRRHDRINTWDLVDRSAIYVIGGYLIDKPRDILYKLAKSQHMAERRTAIVSTLYLIKQGELDDTFKLAQILFNDNEVLVLKAVGWALRSAGDKDIQQLLDFLDKHSSAMPRIVLRNATEKFSPEAKKRFLSEH